MRRFTITALLALAIAELSVGPANAACSAVSSETPLLCADDDKLLPAQHPDHTLVANGQTVTLTGNGTSTLTNVGTGNGTVGGSGQKNYLAKWTSTVTGTATATSTAISSSTIYDDGTFVGVNRTDPVATVDVNGNVRVSGTDTSSSGLMGLAFTRILSGPDVNQDMVRDLTTVTTTSTATGTAAAYCSFDASPTFAGAGYYDHSAAFQNRIEIPGNASMRFTRGYLDYPSFDGSGTLVDRWGFHVYDIRGSGAVTNNIGIKIEDLTRGTNDFAIYTGAGKVRFGDDVAAAGGKAFYSMSDGEYGDANKRWGSLSSESTNGTMLLSGGSGTYSSTVLDISIASYNGTTLTKHIDVDVDGSVIKFNDSLTPTVNGGPALGGGAKLWSGLYSEAVDVGSYSGSLTTYYHMGSSGMSGTKGANVVKNVAAYGVGNYGGTNGTWTDLASITYTPANATGGAGSGSLKASANVQYSTDGLTTCSIRILIGAVAGDVSSQTTPSGYYGTLAVIHPGTAINNSSTHTIKVQITSNNASTCTATGSGYGSVMIFEQ